MKLELKHIAPYLPYKLNCHLIDEFDDVTNEPTLFEVVGASTDFVECNWGKTVTDSFHYLDVIPVLIPMSLAFDFIKSQFDKDDEAFEWFNDDVLNIDELENTKPENLPVGSFNYLIKNHFDVFDLIPNKLAVNSKEVVFPF